MYALRIIIITSRLVVEQGLTMVHPFDDPLVIAGQGTIAMEIMKVMLCGVVSASCRLIVMIVAVSLLILSYPVDHHRSAYRVGTWTIYSCVWEAEACWQALRRTSRP